MTYLISTSVALCTNLVKKNYPMPLYHYSLETTKFIHTVQGKPHLSTCRWSELAFG